MTRIISRPSLLFGRNQLGSSPVEQDERLVPLPETAELQTPANRQLQPIATLPTLPLAKTVSQDGWLFRRTHVSGAHQELKQLTHIATQGLTQALNALGGARADSIDYTGTNNHRLTYANGKPNRKQSDVQQVQKTLNRLGALFSKVIKTYPYFNEAQQQAYLQVTPPAQQTLTTWGVENTRSMPALIEALTDPTTSAQKVLSQMGDAERSAYSGFGPNEVIKQTAFVELLRAKAAMQLMKHLYIPGLQSDAASQRISLIDNEQPHVKPYTLGEANRQGLITVYEKPSGDVQRNKLVSPRTIFPNIGNVKTALVAAFQNQGFEPDVIDIMMGKIKLDSAKVTVKKDNRVWVTYQIPGTKHYASRPGISPFPFKLETMLTYDIPVGHLRGNQVIIPHYEKLKAVSQGRVMDNRDIALVSVATTKAEKGMKQPETKLLLRLNHAVDLASVCPSGSFLLPTQAPYQKTSFLARLVGFNDLDTELTRGLNAVDNLVYRELPGATEYSRR